MLWEDSASTLLATLLCHRFPKFIISKSLFLPLSPPLSQIFAADYRPDGKAFATAGSDRAVRTRIFCVVGEKCVFVFFVSPHTYITLFWTTPGSLVRRGDRWFEHDPEGMQARCCLYASGVSLIPRRVKRAIKFKAWLHTLFLSF